MAQFVKFPRTPITPYYSHYFDLFSTFMSKPSASSILGTLQRYRSGSDCRDMYAIHIYILHTLTYIVIHNMNTYTIHITSRCRCGIQVLHFALGTTGSFWEQAKWLNSPESQSNWPPCWTWCRGEMRTMLDKTESFSPWILWREVEKWRSGEVKVVEARGTWHGTHGVSNEFNERKRQQRVEHVSNDNTSCASWNTSKHETPQAALRDLVGARRGAAAPRSVGASQRFVLHMCHVCDVNMSRKILRWWYNII